MHGWVQVHGHAEVKQACNQLGSTARIAALDALTKLCGKENFDNQTKPVASLATSVPEVPGECPCKSPDCVHKA